jgi:hypothetical protein
MFFLKADKLKAGGSIVRVYAKLPNGFVGIADESIRQAQPHLWTAFQDRLKEFGEDEARKLAVKNGEFYIPEEPRLAELIEGEISTTAEKLEQLREEHEKAVKLDVEQGEESTASDSWFKKKDKKKKGK